MCAALIACVNRLGPQHAAFGDQDESRTPSDYDASDRMNLGALRALVPHGLTCFPTPSQEALFGLIFGRRVAMRAAREPPLFCRLRSVRSGLSRPAPA
jgi:hypothetical protein